MQMITLIKTMKTLKEFYNKYKLVILGFILFSIYFWNRFLRSRTSKELPLTLDLFRFLTLSYICVIFLYIIISLLFPRKMNPIIEKLMDFYLYLLLSLIIILKIYFLLNLITINYS